MENPSRQVRRSGGTVLRHPGQQDGSPEGGFSARGTGKLGGKFTGDKSPERKEGRRGPLHPARSTGLTTTHARRRGQQPTFLPLCSALYFISEINVLFWSSVPYLNALTQQMRLPVPFTRHQLQNCTTFPPRDHQSFCAFSLTFDLTRPPAAVPP